MTPDTLHYGLLLTAWLAVPLLVLASVVLHRRWRSPWSLSLLLGLVAILSGQALQLLSPIDDLAYEEFRGIVVSSGEFPLEWYLGTLVSSAGLLVAAVSALGLALTIPLPSGGRTRRRLTSGCS